VTTLHRLVSIQLAKATRPSGEVDYALLCELMSTCYEEMERDRKRVDRANTLMMEELTELTAEMERLIEALRVQNLHFQAALDNMSQGLCLLDAEGRLTVANHRFLQIYALGANAGEPGRPLADILGSSAVLRSARAYLMLISTRQPGTLLQELSDGRTIRIVHEPLARGGSVDTFEDITERKTADAELATAHRQLLDISRQAGMAEVATGVLHNVGNVLNSVNVSANLLAESVGKSKGGHLARVTALLREHERDLGNFVTVDPQGKHLTAFLEALDKHLAAERQVAANEVDALLEKVGHIKEIVTMQQSFAMVAGVQEQLKVTDLVEDSLRLSVAAFTRHRIEIVRAYEDAPIINVDRHKALQILVNLTTNAKHACVESGQPDRRMTIRVASAENCVKISVIDDGVGIPVENLTRIFNHGFTTRKSGHGFGLHSGALAARELGGSLTVHSEGPGRGATFTLELPLQVSQPLNEEEAGYAVAASA
jgi:signal transduction histidine kinase